MAINFAELFTRLKLAFDMLDTIESHQKMDLETDATAIINEWASTDPVEYGYVSAFVQATIQTQGQTSLQSALVSLAGQEIIRQVQAEYPSFTGSVDQAIDQLVADMEAESESVDNNSCAITVVNPSTQKDRLAVSVTDKSGLPTERLFNETFGVVRNSGSFAIRGQPTISGLKSTWPKGSNLSLSVPINRSSGLITNGDFDSAGTGDTAEYPTDWRVEIGNVGTTIRYTEWATKTIAIAGTPASGFWFPIVTDMESNVYQLDPLDWDATATDLQTALREIPGFESVEVTASGTSPNLTHTITFVGVAGTPASITIHNELNTGTITPTDGSAVDSGGLESRALKFVGNGSELTSISQDLSLLAQTGYAFHVRLKKSTGTTGVLRIALVDGAGSVITDDAGSANSTTVDLSTLSDSSFSATIVFFRAPSDLPDIVRIQLKATTAINSTKLLYLDKASLVQATRHSIGILAAAFGGPTSSVSTDVWTLESTNDYSGRIQTRFMRHFSRQLPSSGSPTIAD